MPGLPNENENLNALNEVENNKLSLIEQYKKQREMKEELDMLAQRRTQTSHAELQKAAQPAWDRFDQKMDEINKITHKNYDVPWGRLMDLLMVFNEALIYQRPIIQASISNVCTSLASGALSVTGGLAGGLVGGASRLFGVGDGVMAGVKKGSDFMLGTPNTEIQYFVEMRDNNTLEYWLKRSDGKVLTQDEEQGYMNDVGVWLKESGYVAGPVPGTFVDNNNVELTQDAFASLRDHPASGLKNYFLSRQLEVKQSLEIMSTSPVMGM